LRELRARLGTAEHFCEAVVLKSKTVQIGTVLAFRILRVIGRGAHAIYKCGAAVTPLGRDGCGAQAKLSAMDWPPVTRGGSIENYHCVHLNHAWWELELCLPLFGRERDQLSYKPGRASTTDIFKEDWPKPRAGGVKGSLGFLVGGLGCLGGSLQGYFAHKKAPTSLGSPYDPRHRPTVGS